MEIVLHKLKETSHECDEQLWEKMEKLDKVQEKTPSQSRWKSTQDRFTWLVKQLST